MFCTESVKKHRQWRATYPVAELDHIDDASNLGAENDYRDGVKVDVEIINRLDFLLHNLIVLHRFGGATAISPAQVLRRLLNHQNNLAKAGAIKGFTREQASQCDYCIDFRALQSLIKLWEIADGIKWQNDKDNIVVSAS